MSITKEQVLNNLEEVKKYIAEAESKEEEKTLGIAIKNRWNNRVIFQSTKTTYKEAIIEKGDANLRGADLRDAVLCDANLCDADLRGANLCDANLSGASLRDANLSNADLRGADLFGADLSGAELNCAKFYGRGGKIKIMKKK